MQDFHLGRGKQQTANHQDIEEEFDEVEFLSDLKEIMEREELKYKEYQELENLLYEKWFRPIIPESIKSYFKGKFNQELSKEAAERIERRKREKEEEIREKKAEEAEERSRIEQEKQEFIEWAGRWLEPHLITELVRSGYYKRPIYQELSKKSAERRRAPEEVIRAEEEKKYQLGSWYISDMDLKWSKSDLIQELINSEYFYPEEYPELSREEKELILKRREIKELKSERNWDRLMDREDKKERMRRRRHK